jgi:hypothetical protein
MWRPVDQAGKALDVVQGAVNDIQHPLRKLKNYDLQKNLWMSIHILARSTDVSALTLTYVTSIIICCFSAVVTTIKCPSIIVSQDHLI